MIFAVNDGDGRGIGVGEDYAIPQRIRFDEKRPGGIDLQAGTTEQVHFFDRIFGQQVMGNYQKDEKREKLFRHVSFLRGVIDLPGSPKRPGRSKRMSCEFCDKGNVLWHRPQFRDINPGSDGKSQGKESTQNDCDRLVELFSNKTDQERANRQKAKKSKAVNAHYPAT